jgi:fucose permease
MTVRPSPLIAAFAALFAVGVWVTVFGPAMPFIADETGVGLGTAGLTLTFLGAGSIAASAVFSWRLGAFDARSVIAGGLVVAAGGAILLGFAPSLTLALAGAFILGVGDGLMVAAGHSLVSVASPDVPRDISRLNLFFAAGAITGPLWAGLALELTGDVEVVFGGVALLALGLIPLALLAPAAGHGEEVHGRVLIKPAIVTLAVVLFLYVGVEFGLGSWLSSYAREAAEASILVGAVISSAYWAALALGRIATTYLIKRHDLFKLLAIAIVAAGASAFALAAFGEVVALAFTAAFFTGLFLAPQWPLVLTMSAREGNPSTTAAIITVGNSGILVFPVLQGAILSSAGPTEGVAVSGVLCVLMLAVCMAGRSHLSEGRQAAPDTMIS